MKKALSLTAFIVLSAFAASAQVGLDSASNAATPVYTPPPVVAEPVAPAYTPPPAPAPPAATTTTTIVTQPAAQPTTTYVPRQRSIDVNRIRFGAFVAPNISWMKPTASTDDANQFNTESSGSRLGFTYGLMAEYFFAENYGIVTGLSVNSTGGKMLVTTRNPTPTASSIKRAEFEYRLQYLDIPLALKLRTDDISGFRFFGQLGASLGFNISKKADYSVTYYDASTTERDTSGSKIKLTGSVTNIAPIMFQMNIGAGAEYPINNKLRFYVALFFNNGFAPDATNPEKFDSEKLGYGKDVGFKDGNTRLNNFALRLGLFF